MAKKGKTNGTSEIFPRQEVPVMRGKTEEETCRNHARVTISPELAAHRVVGVAERDSGLGKHIDAPTMLEVLREQAGAVQAGDLSDAEAMLANQATALQSLFVRLTERAMGAEYMQHSEGYMRMALRAQSQCRTTLETLSTIKHPPIVYAKQANIAQGHQQVNNGVAAVSRARKTKNRQHQLSEVDNELRQDARTQGIAKKDDSALEAVGEVDRTKVPRG